MSENNKVLSRRSLFKVGLGTAGTLAASHAVARVCGIGTGEQDLGPFFPRPGTPIEPVREDSDPQTPIYLANDNDLTRVKGRQGKAQGQVVRVRGIVQGEDCQPIAGATIIIWQASESGRYNHTGDGANSDFQDPRDGRWIERKLDPNFQYWGRALTDSKGQYEFKTIVPGFYPANLRDQWYRPPHIHFMVSAMGFPQLVTQMYFRGDEIKDNEWIQELNQRDFILQSNRLTMEQKQALVVDFAREAGHGDLVGSFDITLLR